MMRSPVQCPAIIFGWAKQVNRSGVNCIENLSLIIHWVMYPAHYEGVLISAANSYVYIQCNVWAYITICTNNDSNSSDCDACITVTTVVGSHPEHSN